MTCELRYLPLFWSDLSDAVAYIANVLESPRAAEKLVDEVEEAILSHAENPTLAAKWKSTRERPDPYYWFKVGNYCVFYVVIDDVMEVRRFLYAARDISSMI